MRIHNWSDYTTISRRRKRQVLLSFTLLALILLVGYAYVWQRVRTLQLAKEHAAQKQLVQSLNERCEALRYEVEQLSSMARIESIAREDLKLMTSNEATLAGSRSARRVRHDSDAASPGISSTGSGESGSGGI